MRRTGIVLSVGVVALFASLWYLTAPPRSEGAYREEAARTAELLRSHVQSARIVAGAVATDDVTHPFATVGLEEAERDAVDAAAAFLAHDPPAGTDDLRSTFAAAAGDTTAALGELRIAAHRGRWTVVAERRVALGALADRLASLEREAAR